jgi:hypothetical protein
LSSSSRKARVAAAVLLAAIAGTLLGRWSQDDADTVVEPVATPPSNAVAYETSLADAVTVLADARVIELDRLRSAGRPGVQARAIAGLEAAYEAAAAELSRIDPPALAARPHAASVIALRGASQAYRRVGAAAAAGDRGGFAGARAGVRRAEAACARRLAATLNTVEQAS